MGRPKPFSVTFIFPAPEFARLFVEAATSTYDVPVMRNGGRITVIMLPEQHELLVAIAHKFDGEAVVT